MNQYYVYIMTNKSRILCTGVTNDLERRVYEHKQKLVPGSTAKYNIDRLVYFEATLDVQVAISREKQIKGWLRAKKIALIESMNQEWADLSLDWLSESESGAVKREILRLRGTSAQNDIQGKHRG
jgi:putative endonuclease